MDENMRLLSSLSPRVLQNRIRHRKPIPVTKLALRRYFRRSTIYEQSRKVKPKDVTIITIESSTSESSGKTSNESPIVISDSDEETWQKPSAKNTPKIRARNKIDIQTPNPILSTAKVHQIEDWVNRVNSAVGNSSRFSEISFISSGDNPAFRSPKTLIAMNSTFVDTAPKKRFDELFPAKKNSIKEETSDKSSTKSNASKKKDKILSPIENNTEKNRSKQSIGSLTRGLDNINLKEISDAERLAEKLLDENYGTDWRTDREKVLPSSVPRIKHKTVTNSEIRMKTDKITKPVSSIKKQLFDNVTVSPWREKFKNICDSDSDGSNEENKPCAEANLHLPKNDIKVKKHSDRSNEENKQCEEAKLPKPKNDIKVKKPRKNIKDTKIVKNDNLEKEHFKTYTFLESLSTSIPLDKCDFSARVYRTTFAKNKHKLAIKLFELFNSKIFENAIPEDTSVEWNKRMTATAGLCQCKKRIKNNTVVQREVKIILSEKVLNSADRLRDTLVHEMCHAATYIVNKVSDGHGVFWKAWAQKAMDTFPELPPIKRCHQYEVNVKYTYKCTGCTYSFGRHKKTLDTESKRCGYCRGKFEVLINKHDKKSGQVQSVPMTPKKEPKGFALFVQENYALTKTPQLKHADVMRKLGEKFQQLKVDQNNAK